MKLHMVGLQRKGTISFSGDDSHTSHSRKDLTVFKN